MSLNRHTNLGRPVPLLSHRTGAKRPAWSVQPHPAYRTGEGQGQGMKPAALRATLARATNPDVNVPTSQTTTASAVFKVLLWRD